MCKNRHNFWFKQAICYYFTFVLQICCFLLWWQSIQALYDNGADPDKKKIIGATGAIPFVENVPLEGIERFQQQLEIVDLIDTEDIGAIQSKINECVEKDPGALEEDPIVMEVDEENERLVIVEDKDDDDDEEDEAEE